MGVIDEVKFTAVCGLERNLAQGRPKRRNGDKAYLLLDTQVLG